MMTFNVYRKRLHIGIIVMLAFWLTQKWKENLPNQTSASVQLWWRGETSAPSSLASASQGFFCDFDDEGWFTSTQRTWLGFLLLLHVNCNITVQYSSGRIEWKCTLSGGNCDWYDVFVDDPVTITACKVDDIRQQSAQPSQGQVYCLPHGTGLLRNV